MEPTDRTVYLCIYKLGVSGDSVRLIDRYACHYSIVVFGLEYHQLATGITIGPPAGTYLEKIQLGDTERTQEELEEFVRNIKSSEFQFYCVFSKNCILFANATSEFLLDKPIAWKYRRVVDRFLWFFDLFGYICFAAMYIGVFLLPGWRDALITWTQSLESFGRPRTLLMSLTGLYWWLRHEKNYRYALAFLPIAGSIYYFF